MRTIFSGLFYTSGTTGGPKGVMLTHLNLWSHTLQIMHSSGITQGVWLHAAPMFHAADFWSIYVHAVLGSANVYLPTFHPGRVPAPGPNSARDGHRNRPDHD